ncbi:hypothetical protein [Jannaschia sp. CCS1]|uniref:hypothetical protein n=1 Tax=Jannaschia sp. (strain CCS1) TaxID=290400 RepID=UPI000053BA6C|nr:hypothetical protein [Jannaschia sp. CCS1]ABD55623.1 hypothetical protein Jann_2706 [Jannaschia sp. CCS1]
MNSKIWLALGATLALTACVQPTPEGQTEVLPPEVLGLVAPGQDTNSVRLQQDGCYWYLHNNVVESVYIPLLTRDQRMICVTAQ